MNNKSKEQKDKESNIVNILKIAKRRGFMYPSFEIYGGMSGFYDYGPMGCRIKKNIEDMIRRYYVVGEGCQEVECPLLSPEEVWIASGHIKNFSDAIAECEKCGEPYRADHLIEDLCDINCDGMSLENMQEIICGEDKSENESEGESKSKRSPLKCPKCGGNFKEIYAYNLMFGTEVGPGSYKKAGYLRPETAQMTYISFNRLWEYARRKLPFGVLQIGKSFRNEISPRQGMIRLREFNQAEVQFFVDPSEKSWENFNRFSKISVIPVKILTKDAKDDNDNLGEPVIMTIGEAVSGGVIEDEKIAYFLGLSVDLFCRMGLDRERLRLRQHRDSERAFYSSDTWDVEYMSPLFGRIEIVGVSNRSDYDLGAHQKLSGENMRVNYNGRKFIPHVIEVAYGIDRPFYCAVESCYREDERGCFFSFPKYIAPYFACVFPLVKKDGIDERAREVFNELTSRGFYVLYDKSGSIGRRYARADEVGIPYCVTVDYDTLKDNTVTVRERDTKDQERVDVSELADFLAGR